LKHPKAEVNKDSLLSGRIAASAWWAFLFVSLGFTYTRETYYLPFPTWHLVLVLLAFFTLLLHVRKLEPREVPEPGRPAAQWKHFLLLILAVLVLILIRTERNSGFFTARQELKGVEFPVRYNTSDIRAGKPLSPDPRLFFEESRSCNADNCHPKIYRQWSISSHRYAAVLKPYRKLIELVYDELGPEATLLCSKCHAPLLAMLGLPDDPNDPSLDRYRNDGVTCQYCHVIRKACASESNGNFMLEFRQGHFKGHETTEKTGKRAIRSYMLKNLSRHRKTFPLRDPEENEYCVGCHRVVMPPEFVGDRKLVLGDVHTPFIQSKSAAERISCSECHMNLATYWGQAYHARPDHRTPGTNNAIAKMVLPPSPVESDLGELDRVTEAFLRGNYAVPGYEVLYLRLIANRKHDAFVRYLQDNPKINLSILAPPFASAGQALSIVIHLENKTGAHIIPSGPIDLNQYWLEVIAESQDGRRLYASGVMGRDHFLPENTILFGGIPLDEKGQPVEKHRFWQTRSVKDRRTIPVDGSYDQPFVIDVPSGLTGKIRIKASFCYRRYNQKMADWIYDSDGTTFPVYRYGSAQVEVDIRAADAMKPMQTTKSLTADKERIMQR